MTSQPCALCRGTTVWDPVMGSWRCPVCRVCTAPSDGLEADRLARGIRILSRIAYDVAARRRPASSVAARKIASEVSKRDNG